MRNPKEPSMTSWKLLVGGLLVSALLLPPSTLAKRKSKKETFKWEKITQADWDTGRKPATDDQAVMLFEKISVDDRQMDDDKVFRTLYRKIRILNEAGRHWADVDVPHVHGEYRITSILGQTTLPDGKTIELTEDNIHSKTVIKIEGSKLDQTSFSMPGVTDDCIIEYRISYRSDGDVGGWLIQKDIPLLLGEYQWNYFDFDKSRNIWFSTMPFIWTWLTEPEYVWQNISPRAPKRYPHPLIQDSTEMIFTVKNIPPFENEPQSVPDRSLRARLLCYYGNGTLPVVFWSDLTSNMAEWMDERFCEKKTKLLEVVANLAPGEPRDERIRAAYKWVQTNIINTTFFDLDKVLEERGAKSKKKREAKFAETADEVIKNGHGYASNINALFCAMLVEMGIDARYACVVDRFDDLFSREAKYWQFDRRIVAVYDSIGDTQFYSPGVPYMPCGSVPWFTEGVQALMEGIQGDLVTVPCSDAEANVQTIIYNYNLVPDAATTGSVQARLTGQNANYVRGRLLNIDESEFDDILKEATTSFLPSGEADSTECKGLDESGEALTLTCQMSFPEVTTQAGRLLIKPFDFFVDRDNPFVSQDRNTPIMFRNSYARKESAQIDLPEEWVIEALPRDTIFANRIGKCGVQFVQLGNKLSVQRHFTLNAPLWQVADYADVRALFQARQEMSDCLVVLNQRTPEGSTE